MSDYQNLSDEAIELAHKTFGITTSQIKKFETQYKNLVEKIPYQYLAHIVKKEAPLGKGHSGRLFPAHEQGKRKTQRVELVPNLANIYSCGGFNTPTLCAEGIASMTKKTAVRRSENALRRTAVAMGSA